MLEAVVGDAVPWRPGHTVQRLVPRGGTDLLTLDQHSKRGFTVAGEQRNNTVVVVGRSLPPWLARSLHRLATTKSRETSGRARDRSRGGGGKEPPRTLAHTSIDPSSSSSVAAVARVLRSARINTEYLPDSAQARRRRRRRGHARRRVCSRACARNARPRPSVRSPARRPGEPQLLRCGMTFPSSDVRPSFASRRAKRHRRHCCPDAFSAFTCQCGRRRRGPSAFTDRSPTPDSAAQRPRDEARARAGVDEGGTMTCRGCRKLWCKWKGMQRGRARVVRGSGKSLSPVEKRSKVHA